MWSLITFDVWGNARDGYEVNDQRRTGLRANLPPNAIFQEFLVAHPEWDRYITPDVIEDEGSPHDDGIALVEVNWSVLDARDAGWTEDENADVPSPIGWATHALVEAWLKAGQDRIEARSSHYLALHTNREWVPVNPDQPLTGLQRERVRTVVLQREERPFGEILWEDSPPTETCVQNGHRYLKLLRQLEEDGYTKIRMAGEVPSVDTDFYRYNQPSQTLALSDYLADQADRLLSNEEGWATDGTRPGLGITFEAGILWLYARENGFWLFQGNNRLHYMERVGHDSDVMVDSPIAFAEVRR